MPSNLTAANLISSIKSLDAGRFYEYPSGRGSFSLLHVGQPEGPVVFRRKASHSIPGERETAQISATMLATVSSVFSRHPNYPIHFDRLFSAGGNARSALEAMLAYTRNFYLCYPKRRNPYTGEIETNQKHLMWCPDQQHNLGELETKEFSQIISSLEVDTEFTPLPIDNSVNITEEIAATRKHIQVQAALVEIGGAFTYRTWIANNDRSTLVGNTTLGGLTGVIPSLDPVSILHSIKGKQAARLIDVIWFTPDFEQIPVVIEVEHTTGVTSGLDRMTELKSALPGVSMRFAIAAPDEARTKVVQEANRKSFRSMNARYFSYSAIQELLGITRRYKFADKRNEFFVESFMEQVVQ